MKIKTGELVKSRDFAGVANCFYVGIVTSIDEIAGTFTAATLYRVFDGRRIKTNVPLKFTAALPAASLLDEIDPARITRLNSHSEVFQELNELEQTV